MKSILWFFLFLFIITTGVSAQEYYIQAGFSNVVVNADGVLTFDKQHASRLGIKDEGNSKFRIWDKNTSRFFYHDLNNYPQITTTNSSYGSLFGFEKNTVYGGWLIYRYFPDGKKYYLVNSLGLGWMPKYSSTAFPAVLKLWKTSGQSNGQNTQTRKPKPRKKVSTDTRPNSQKRKKPVRAKRNSDYGKPAKQPKNQGKKVYGRLYIDCKSKAPCSPYGLVVTVRGKNFNRSSTFYSAGDVFDFGRLPIGRYQVTVRCKSAKFDSAIVIPRGKEIVIRQKQTTTVKFNF